MNTILRSLIVWLVLLAVPFQGFASAAMLACGAGHATPAQAAMPHVGHAMTHGMAGHDMSGHDMAAHDHASMAHAASSQPDTFDHGGAHLCSACSACSIGAAIAPALLPALAVHAAPLLSVPIDDGRLPSVHLALPERPPRPFLA